MARVPTSSSFLVRAGMMVRKVNQPESWSNSKEPDDKVGLVEAINFEQASRFRTGTAADRYRFWDSRARAVSSQE